MKTTTGSESKTSERTTSELERPRYLSCADTAKLIRKALKAAFPGVKFSVRSSSYSMGASIRVGWVESALLDPGDVGDVVRVYEGSGFDGSIDLKYSVYSWLLPDGTVTAARSTGTEGSRGSVPGWDYARPSDDAELVSFGADYVYCEPRR